MPADNYDYDFAVIGGGSGGVRAARIAAQHGAKTVLFEEAALGGTCVNVGCVPKKLFTYAAEFGEQFELAPHYGWNFGPKPEFDWSTLIANKNAEIARLNGIYRRNLEKAGVEIVECRAAFEGPHCISAGAKNYTARHICIATGGRPNRMSVPGAEYAVSSDDMFYLDNLPQRAVIVGGGYIGVEFAGILHGLGVQVDLVYRGPLFLSSFDDSLRENLAASMRAQGINLHFNSTPERIEKTGNSLFLYTKDEEKPFEAGLILAAIGRHPNIEGLDLDRLDLDRENDGRIRVDEASNTSSPGIYAIGDVANRYHLTPVAITEGHALADRLFGGEFMQNRIADLSTVPTGVFSHPPIGTVGLSEKEARARGHNLTIYEAGFRPMKATMAPEAEGEKTKTTVKLVVDRDTDSILGAHMLGADAPEIIQGLAVAIQAGAKKRDFDTTIAVHPTTAEEFVTLRSPAKRD